MQTFLLLWLVSFSAEAVGPSCTACGFEDTAPPLLFWKPSLTPLGLFARVRLRGFMATMTELLGGLLPHSVGPFLHGWGRVASWSSGSPPSHRWAFCTGGVERFHRDDGRSPLFGWAFCTNRVKRSPYGLWDPSGDGGSTEMLSSESVYHVGAGLGVSCRLRACTLGERVVESAVVRERVPFWSVS